MKITIVTGNGAFHKILQKTYSIFDFSPYFEVEFHNRKKAINFPENMTSEKNYFATINKIFEDAKEQDIIIYTYSPNFIETIQVMADLKQIDESIEYIFVDVENDKMKKFSIKSGYLHDEFWNCINNEFDEWDHRLDYLKGALLARDINGKDISYDEEINYIINSLNSDKDETKIL